MAGRLQDTSYPCIVTAFAGKPVSKLSRAQRRTASEALNSLVYMLLGLVMETSACQIFKQDGSCLLADLAHCVMDSSQDQQQRETLQLAKL